MLTHAASLRLWTTDDASARSGARWTRGPATTAALPPRPDRPGRAHDGRSGAVLAEVVAARRAGRGLTAAGRGQHPTRRARRLGRTPFGRLGGRGRRSAARALRRRLVDRPCRRADAGGVRRSRTARRRARDPGAGAGGARRGCRRADGADHRPGGRGSGHRRGGRNATAARPAHHAHPRAAARRR
ncbi:hypothetical protein CF8_2585 [Nocardioides sp. CF8]|nr:hypothetical protein CF8_2585 [Nocardioides sp. CF8]